MLQLVLRCLKTIVTTGRFMIEPGDFYQASMYHRLSDLCWNLQEELSSEFVGYERLIDLLVTASIEFNEKFEELVGYGKDTTV